MKKLISLLLLAASTLAFGANKTFVRSYTYQASESDSKITARANALAEVKRLLLEELGVYMESYVNYTVEEQNMTITKDFFTNEIKQLSVGTTETKILEETWNGEQYYVKAEIQADPTEVARTLSKALDSRRSAAVIDSLRVLLTNTSSVSAEQAAQIASLNTELQTQTEIASELVALVNKLRTELTELKAQIKQSEEEKAKITSEIQRIRNELNDATVNVKENAKIGMLVSDVRRLCGEPRKKDVILSNAFWYNYGYLWLGFENDILVVGVEMENYKGYPPHMCNRENILTR